MHRTAAPKDGATDAAAPNRRALLIGGLGALTAIAVSVGVWRRARGDGDGQARDEALLASAPLAAEETSNTAPDVDGYAGLRQRLVNYQIPEARAAAAVAALQAVAGPDPGRMHLIIRLKGADSARPELIGAELRRAADGAGYLLSAKGDGFAVTVLPAALIARLVPHSRGQVNRDGLYASAVGDLSADLMTQFAGQKLIIFCTTCA